MEWSSIPAASGYEIQMSASGGRWATIAPCFGSTLLRKKGETSPERFAIKKKTVTEFRLAVHLHAGNGGREAFRLGRWGAGG